MAVAGSLLQFQERGVGLNDYEVGFRVCNRCLEKYHEARKVAEADINFELLYPNSAKRQRAIMLNPSPNPGKPNDDNISNCRAAAGYLLT